MPLGVESPNYLASGMSGPGVKELQTDLIQLGFNVGSTGADGKFGTNTAQAVKNFQYTWGNLIIDGVVESQTAAAIKEAIGLLSQGQWNSSSDPQQYVSGVSQPRAPIIPTSASLFPSQAISVPLLGSIDWKWLAIGIAGVAAIFFLRGKGED